MLRPLEIPLILIETLIYSFFTEKVNLLFQETALNDNFQLDPIIKGRAKEVSSYEPVICKMHERSNFLPDLFLGNHNDFLYEF